MQLTFGGDPSRKRLLDVSAVVPNFYTLLGSRWLCLHVKRTLPRHARLRSTKLFEAWHGGTTDRQESQNITEFHALAEH